MRLMTANVAGFGSRFNIILDPYRRRIRHGSMGMFLDRESELLVGVRGDDKAGSFLPFSEEETRSSAIYMSMSMNSVTYTAKNPADGYDLIFTLTSPFIPEDTRLNTAPFFYVDITIRQNTRPHNLVKTKRIMTSGTLIFGLRGNGLVIDRGEGRVEVRYSIPTKVSIPTGDISRTLQLSMTKDGEPLDSYVCREVIESHDGRVNADGLFEVDFDFARGTEAKSHFVWATYVPENFIMIRDEPFRLLYTSLFGSVDDVLDFARENADDWRAKSSFFDSVIEESTLSRSWKDLIAFTFQSFKMNALWAVSDSGRESFTVWEGNCMYNSTVDVEYNDGLFYYAFYPSLLPMLFKEWAETEGGRGFINHDLGGRFSMGMTAYDHHMEIEENTNFILMLQAYVSMTGDDEPLTTHYGLATKLVDHIIAADTMGTGIPAKGTSNTIDDSIPAIQHARQQTYLGMKSFCALKAFAEMAGKMGDSEGKERSEAQAAKIISTIDSLLWRGDHYAVCLDQTQDGYRRFLSNEPLSGEMEGRNAYSIYAENGLLYPFLAGLELPGIDKARLRQDINNSFQKTLTDYGCNHTSEGSDSVWISQNLWRDFVAAYLGVDLLDNVDRYLEFQKIMNSDGRSTLFIDTYGENALTWYPRGLTSVGVLFAMLRLQVDSGEHKIYISPLRRTLRLPLTMFADWEGKAVPWVVVEDGRIKQIENGHLLGGWDVVCKE